ncbi:hypothetical protein I6A60_02960 [Frankia sp. AgB1.9]|uniref:hypothetical protein n=1 Tax=unclassified Frankia TaxID=2632575 RepID=UPI001931870D|nr:MULTISPECIES: hypothetical protein [unclassified Frankia]MBL7546843.1 hypothetical protein [Frankia sp. AgB1.9]MBL7622513.1 hypothetical protein [Frankia sp. AgB1.8]
MGPFDANDYRSRVLGPIHARGGVEHSDPFEIYDIPLAEATTLDDAAVSAQIDAVWAFWQRSRDHPRYRGVIDALLRQHPELAAALRGRRARVELAQVVAQARAEREDERFATVAAAADRLVERFGGLPEDKIPGLRLIATGAGVDAAEFDRRIAGYPRVPAGTPERTTRRSVPRQVLRQVRADLDELGRIVGEDAPRSLFDLLGVPPGSDLATVRSARDGAATRNRARRPDRRRALIDDLLAAVTTLLLDGDPEAYLDALAAAAADLLRPRLAAVLLVEDRLLPADAALLVTAARGEGLDRARAEAVVRALAREAGVDEAVITQVPEQEQAQGSAPERRTRPTPARGTTREPVATSGHAASAAATAGRSRHGSDQDWREILEQARVLLDAGAPIAAHERLAHALEIAGTATQPIRALGEAIESVIRRAHDGWARLTQAVAAHRLEQARQLAAELSRIARDVPGPDGADLATVTVEVEERHQRAGELLAAAAAAAPAERAALAMAALELAADSDEARALLLESLLPPGALAVRRAAGAVEVSWVPSPTPGVHYRVLRIGTDGSSRAVGVTATTRIDDGGVPAEATLPGYEVRAGIAGVWSQPAVWQGPAAEELAAETITEPAGGPTAQAADAIDPEDESTRLLTRTPADSLEPARDLAVVAGRLQWTWPDGCTEVIVTWRPDMPPIAANDPVAGFRKVTNARYELDDGLPLPATRPLYIAIFGCVRDRAGQLIVASIAAPPARRLLPTRDRLA